MDPQCRARYEIKSHRKENLLRLRRFLNEVIFDQLPPLTELLRTLEELAISGHLTQQAVLPGQRSINYFFGHLTQQAVLPGQRSINLFLGHSHFTQLAVLPGQINIKFFSLVRF